MTSPENPSGAPGGPVEGGGTDPPHDPRPAATTLADADAPTMVGPYRLCEVIAGGGMGTVYRAEQTAPIRREVAFKLINPGMDSRRVIARFEAERQALALMGHPNIARALDAGTAPSGRPFFVMELVRGEALTAYADRVRLGLRGRLELFVPICAAVQHAHQKGIIHRDLKPANVIVAEEDGRPVPKVIDFGVAKATGEALIEDPVRTQYGHLMGTPAYMSPEQAQGGPDVDTRADLYALGVLLYELLTGETPFTARRLDTAGYNELVRILSEEEPPRPSDRFAALPGPRRAEVAAFRSTDPERLRSQLRGDLDWIILKAIEKDRDRRYLSADALAADLRRALRHEPVEASPPTPLYRVKKFARRYRFGLVAVGLFAATCLAGAGASAWLTYRAGVAEQEALETRRQGDILIGFMLETLYRELESAGRLPLLEGVARRVSAYYEGLPDTPSARGYLTRADGVGRMGQIRFAQGNLNDARVALVDRHEILFRHYVRSPDAEANLALARSHVELGRLHRSAGDLQEALRHLDRADDLKRIIPVGRDAAGSRQQLRLQYFDESAQVHHGRGNLAAAIAAARSGADIRPGRDGEADVASALLRLAQYELEAGRLPAAETAAATATRLAAPAGLPAGRPGDTRRLRAQVFLARVGSQIARARGDFNRAQRQLLSALPPARAQVARDASNANAKEDLAATLDELARTHFAVGAGGAAETAAAEAVGLRQEVAGRYPGNAGALEALARGELLLARVRQEFDLARPAAANARRSIEICRQLLATNPGNRRVQATLAGALATLGKNRAHSGSVEGGGDGGRAEGETLVRSALEIRLFLAASDPVNATWQAALAETHATLGAIHLAGGDPGGATARLASAVAQQRKIVAAGSMSALHRFQLAHYLTGLGRAQAAGNESAAAAASFREAAGILDRLIAAGGDPATAPARWRSAADELRRLAGAEGR